MSSPGNRFEIQNLIEEISSILNLANNAFDKERFSLLLLKFTRKNRSAPKDRAAVPGTTKRNRSVTTISPKHRRELIENITINRLAAPGQWSPQRRAHAASDNCNK